MAASSMGAFGTYKTQYYRYLQEREARQKAALQQQQAPTVETVWVTQRYDPLDPRVLAPVPRHKLVVSKFPAPTERHWVPVTEPPLRCFEREQPEVTLASFPSTRDEQWSTLRQILPSRGSARKMHPPCWGTGQGPPPFMTLTQPRRLPKVNSPMTRYMDDMYATNRLTKIH